MSSTPSPSEAPASFAAYLQARRGLVEDWIAAHEWSADASGGATVARDLASYLYGPLARFNAGGGKRVRPILVLLGCEAVGGEAESGLSAGCAIELFQSAALIHDDIADASEMRRGEPCMHVAEGTPIAIIVGDAALVQASCAITSDERLSPETCLRLLSELLEMERDTLEGQALDLGWVRDDRWDITPDDYLVMATRKTAHYSAATPLRMGAICGGGSPEQIEALGAFGLEAGLAFQIADDLLNLVGDAETQGKDFRSDITEGKRTLVATTALERLAGPERDELLGILSSHATDEASLARAVELMEAAGALDAARERARELVDDAVAHLDEADFEPAARELLISMAHFFVERAR